MEGLHYIHSQGLIHRDIKPDNIFINQSAKHSVQVKLGDLGLCRRVISSSDISGQILPSGLPMDCFTADCGTLTYMAPEQHRHDRYDCKVDMYALGVVLFEMFSRFRSNRERLEKVIRLRESALDAEGGANRCIIEGHPLTSGLIGQLVQYDPKSRPTTLEVLRNDALPIAFPTDFTPAQEVYMRKILYRHNSLSRSNTDKTNSSDGRNVRGFSKKIRATM